MKNIPRIGIVCLTMLVLIMSVSAVMHGAGKSSGKAEPQEHWEGGMLPEDSPVTTRSYWRHWLTYSPPRLLIGDRLAPSAYRFSAFSAGGSYNQGTTAPPPAGWAGADFDDSAWPVQRVPMNTVHKTAINQYMIRQTCLRTRFMVPDPEKVKKLTFAAVYHGGLIVRVNGREIGRQHIPAKGLLAKEGFAEPFPDAAYGPGKDEMKLARKLKAYAQGGWYWGHILGFYKQVERYKNKPEVLQFAQRVRKLFDRRIEVEVPPEALRKGVNVLALELRLSPCRRKVPSLGAGWPHGLIRFVTLDARPAGAVLSANSRPDGVQAWTEDIHRRIMTQEFLEPGVKKRKTIRLLGARGGRYSGQVLLGTTKDLPIPSAKLGDLSGPGGAVIPSSAMSLRWGQPLGLLAARTKSRELDNVKRERHASISMALLRYRQPVWAFREKEERLCYPSPAPLFQRGGNLVLGRYGVQQADLWKEHGKGLMFYDCLSPISPKKVSAGTCRPLWVTVDVPDNAQPGLYVGKLTVSARGMKEEDFTVCLQVFDWKLPDPKKYTIYSGVEQCPWSLAKCAGVKLWSEEHWKLVEESVKWCGKLGSRTVGLPVVHDSHVDNGKDTMVKWIKAPDGGFTYDFSLADRYLKLWRKHCHPQSDVIVHVLHNLKHTRTRVTTRPGTVVVVDPRTGKESTLTPIGEKVTADGIKLWIDCCKAIRAHLNAQGIPDERILFGMFGDLIDDVNRAVIDAVAEALPGTGWARSSHYGTAQKKRKVKYDAYGKQEGIGKVKWDAARRAAMTYIKRHVAPFTMKSKTVTVNGKRHRFRDPETYEVLQHRGWKNPQAPLSCSMNDNDVTGLSMLAPPWHLRSFAELTITTAYRGFAPACLDGYERCPQMWGPFIRWLVYPEKERVNGSARFEILREGIQDAEVRIFLEGKDNLPKDIQSLLDRRTERGWYLPSMPRDGGQGAEFYGGWQEASWDLYAAAARIAGGKVSSEEEKKRFFGK